MLRWCFLSIILGLGACTVGPDFNVPEIPVVSDWFSTSHTSQTEIITTLADPSPSWWKDFHDSELNSLIDRAVAGNLDLRQAVLRIDAARSQIVSEAAAGLPSLSANANYTREQLGLRGVLREKQINTATSTTGSSSNFIDQLEKPFDLFQDSLNASWELDLFGRVRRSVEVAEAQQQAQIEEHNAILVSLEAEVAQTYAQLRGAQILNEINTQNIEIENNVVTLTQQRRDKGLVSDVDVDNAKTQFDIAQASVPGYATQIEVLINRLSLLLGQAPGYLDNELTAQKPLPPLPAEISVGLPASLAKRRPDIREAEAKLHQATAALGVAIADTYPDISLTGSIGTRGSEAQDLTRWASHFYSAGPAVTLPIFQGGRLTANIDLATAQQQEAALNYRETVLKGLQEVENALITYRSDCAQQKAYINTAIVAEDSFKLSKNRYQNGLSNFIEVLNAETGLVQARQQVATSTLNITTDVVNLYRALGGGWESTDDAQAKTSSDFDHILEK